MPGVIIVLKYPIPLFLFNWESGNVSKYLDFGNCWQIIMRNDKNYDIIVIIFILMGDNVGKIMSMWTLRRRQ